MKNIIILIPLFVFAFISNVSAQQRTKSTLYHFCHKVFVKHNTNRVAAAYKGPKDHHDNRKLASTLAQMRHKTRKGGVDPIVVFYIVASLCFSAMGCWYGFRGADEADRRLSIVSFAAWILGISFMVAFMTASGGNNRQKVHDQAVFIRNLQHVLQGKVDKLDEAEWETRQLQDQIDSLERLHGEALYAVDYLSSRIDTLEGGRINGKVVPRSVLTLQKKQ